MQIENAPVCIFLNTRNDRRYRTNQLLDLIFNYIQPKILIVRGENLPTQFYSYKNKFSKMKINELPYDIGINENWKQIFGNNPYLYPFPIFCGSGKPKGDGIYWETIQSQQELLQK